MGKKIVPGLIIAILSSLCTAVFGYIAYRADIVNKKADISYVDSADKKVVEGLSIIIEKNEEQNDKEHAAIDSKMKMQYETIMTFIEKQDKFMDKQDLWIERVEKKIDRINN